MKYRKFRLDSASLVLSAVFVLFAAVETVGPQVPLGPPVVGFALFAFLMGALCLTAIGMRPRLASTWIVYAVGTSLVVVTALGLMVNLFLPVVGYDRPLSFFPLATVHVTVVVALSVLLRIRDTDTAVEVPLPESLDDIDFQLPFLLLLPLLAILSVMYLNVTGSNIPLISLLVITAAIPIFGVLSYFNDRHLPLAIWAVAMALLCHKIFFVGFTYGGHTAPVDIWQNGYWSLEGESLLIHGILMPVMARLLRVEILTQLKAVMPIVISIIPVSMYIAFARYTNPKKALLGASLFFVAHPFYFIYPGTPRGYFPVLFLALLGTVISDQGLASVHKRALWIIFAVGLIVSHYGTSYYAMFAVVGTLGILYCLRIVDELWQQFDVSPDDGYNLGVLDRVASSVRRVIGSRKVAWLNFTGFYTISVLSYYLYVDQGSKFAALTNQIINAYVSLFLGGGGQGSSAVRLATDYGGVSIQLSKYLYVVVGVLVGVGVLVAGMQRLLPWFEIEFDDEYLGMAVMLFGLFGGTFIISGQWGGGRPMMIVFSFCAIFAVVGITWLGSALRSGIEFVQSRVADQRWGWGFRPKPFHRGTQIAFAVFLAVFLILNTGVAAAVLYGGEAPSNIPAGNPDEVNIHRDIQTHAWLADNRNNRYAIYGDRNARAQTTDWVSGEIAAVSERSPYRFRKSNFFEAVNDSDVEPGYIVLVTHNIISDKVVVDYITSRPIDVYQLSLEQRNKVYVNGAGSVYFHPKPPKDSDDAVGQNG